MFNLFRIVPTYDHRDCVVGERAIAHPYTFVTEAGALAVRRLLSTDAAADMCEHFVVRPLGASPFRPHINDWAVTVRAEDDEIPF